jgi:hypothetical protein
MRCLAHFIVTSSVRVSFFKDLFEKHLHKYIRTSLYDKKGSPHVKAFYSVGAHVRGTARGCLNRNPCTGLHGKGSPRTSTYTPELLCSAELYAAP